MKDYYGLLGLDSSASEDDIKKAYRKMAVKWHPDKNPDQKEEAEKMFKEVAEAYEVLSDPQKRKMVDQGIDPNEAPSRGFSGGGGGGRRSGPSFAHRDPFDVFNAFFGGRDPFADFFNDDLFAGFGSRGGQAARSSNRGSNRSAGGGGGRGPFGRSLFEDDDFFGGGFGSGIRGFGSGLGAMGMMGMGSGGSGSFFSSSSFGGGLGGGGSGRTVTQTTSIINGREVTQKVTKVSNPDGSVSETVEEITRGPNGQMSQNSNTQTIPAGSAQTQSLRVRSSGLGQGGRMGMAFNPWQL
jgi:DnaJ family protein B protein 6